jgi:hypothetical protein
MDENINSITIIIIGSDRAILYNINNILNTTNHSQSDGEGESIKHGVDGLEHGDVLHEGTVPHEAKEEGANENDEYKHEELGERIGFGLRFGNFLNHLLHVDIFFCGNCK